MSDVTTKTILEVSGLTVSFEQATGSTTVVNDVSFEVLEGETLGIVGESGCGKTVTVLSILGLLPETGTIDSGKMIFEGSDLAKLPVEEIRKVRGSKIAMIFQEPMTSLNPVLTCGYQVAEALRLHLRMSKQEAKARTIALFEKVQLPRPEQIYAAYPHEISGGQKQRVMIAMAISCNPAVLIADEPTTALDVTVQASILELLKSLQQEQQMGMLFITHDLGVISGIADRVVVMYKGKIVETGPVKSVFASPQHPYTKGLLACRPPLQKRLHRLPVIADFMREESDGNFTALQPEISLLPTNEVSKEERASALKIGRAHV